MVTGLGLVAGHFDGVVLVISRLGLMVARLGLVVGFSGCWVGIGGKDSMVGRFSGCFVWCNNSGWWV